jgi:hypothetical protein
MRSKERHAELCRATSSNHAPALKRLDTQAEVQMAALKDYMLANTSQLYLSVCTAALSQPFSPSLVFKYAAECKRQDAASRSE